MKTIPIRSILDKSALVAFTLLNAISSEAVAQPAIAAPIANWSYIHHSSTELEGALRGQAEVISAFATYRYMDSLAVVNYQEAYRRAIDNRYMQVQRYLEERAMVLEHRQKKLHKSSRGEPVGRANDRGIPKRLTASQFIVQTGTLNWPIAFYHPKYQEAKAVIDRCFARRNAEGYDHGSECEVAVTRLCKVLEKLVNDRARELSPAQKSSAIEFLCSVALESQNPVSGLTEGNHANHAETSAE